MSSVDQSMKHNLVKNIGANDGGHALFRGDRKVNLWSGAKVSQLYSNVKFRAMSLTDRTMFFSDNFCCHTYCLHATGDYLCCSCRTAGYINGQA